MPIFCPILALIGLQDKITQSGRKKGKVPLVVMPYGRKQETKMADRIALVDDDQNILTSVALALESEGFEVDSYSDSEAALAGITRRKVDLAVLDLSLIHI